MSGKPLLSLVLIPILFFSTLGCAHHNSRCPRYFGWEYVRIEDKVPSDQCVYKVQEVCPIKGAKALIWFKKHARLYGANTVVITKTLKGIGGSITATPGGANFDANSESYIAEYYDCPNNKIVKER
jgi:hypothetical protein